MSMIFDEYGRPFIILREQQAQARIRGKEAQKVRMISEIVRLEKTGDSEDGIKLPGWFRHPAVIALCSFTGRNVALPPLNLCFDAGTPCLKQSFPEW